MIKAIIRERSAESFGILSAMKYSKCDGVNQQLHEQLKLNLNNLGYSCIEIRCKFRYTGDVGQMGAEKALFVPSVNLYDLMMLANKYEQMAVLYKNTARFELLGTAMGQLLKSFPVVITDKIFEEAYSKYLAVKTENCISQRICTLEELQIPTVADSLKNLKSNAGLAVTEWVKIF